MAAYLKLVISESDVNIAKNTSKVTAKLYYYGNGVSYNYNNPSGTITIDGTEYSFNHDFTKSSSSQLLATKSKTVTHGSDGSKTVKVSATFKTGVSLGTMTTSASKALTKIARTSTLSLNKTSVPADAKTTVIATANKQSSSLTDTLTVTLGNYNKTITSGVAFTIPKSWVNGISGTSAKATVKVTTKSSSTTIGSNTKELTITVPSDEEFYPEIDSVNIEEAVEKVSNAFPGLYVQNLSQLNVSIDATGAYSSTVKSYSTSLNGITYIQQAFTSNVLDKAGNISITTKITDSRGRTNSKTSQINVVDYSPPSIKTMKCCYCDENGNENSEGPCTKVLIGYKFYPVENEEGEPQNTRAMKLSYRAMSEEGYTERNIELSDWEGSVEVLINNTDPTITYEYIVRLTDKIGSPEPTRITSGVVALSRRAGGTGVTVGGEAELPGFVVANGWDATFSGDIFMEVDPEFDALYTAVFGSGGGS